MRREEIEQHIPHRAPFMWLDEIVEIGEKRIHARKYLDPTLDVFAGHYPHFPVLPGVIQCEMAMQAGAVLISQIGKLEEGSVPVATRLNNVKFRRLVRPGETVDIEVEFTEKVRIAYFMTGKVSVNGEVSTRLEFAFAATRPDQNML